MNRIRFTCSAQAKVRHKIWYDSNYFESNQRLKKI